VVEEARPDAGGFEPSLHMAFGAHPCLPEMEDFLHGDDIALHPGQLRQADETPAAVHQPRGTDPRDLHHCQLTAVHPADNDIHPVDNRRVKAQPAELPAPVARRILDHVSDQAKKQFTLSEWFEAQQRCADIFSPVFKLNGPDGLQLNVDVPAGIEAEVLL